MLPTVRISLTVNMVDCQSSLVCKTALNAPWLQQLKNFLTFVLLLYTVPQRLHLAEIGDILKRHCNLHVSNLIEAVWSCQVPLGGLEPPTYGLEGHRSFQLSYRGLPRCTKPAAFFGCFAPVTVCAKHLAFLNLTFDGVPRTSYGHHFRNASMFLGRSDMIEF